MATISFPQWFQSVWGLFSAEPPIPIIRNWLKTVDIILPAFSAYWITVPIGLAMFSWLIYELRSGRRTPDYATITPQVDLAQDADPNEAAFVHGFNKATFKSDPSRQAAVLRLTQLRSEGVRIRNAGALIDDNNVQEWLKAIVDWMNEVVGVIQGINEADSEYFKTLDTVPPPRVQINSKCMTQTNQSDYLNYYRQHDLRLVRLDQLLKKYGVSA